MSIAHAIQSIGFLTDFRESALVYPVVMSTHLTCIAVFGGMILMTDLRLLGVAMTDRSISEVVSKFRLWKRVGFCIMVTAGLLLASSEAEKYSPNPFFWAKLTFLALIGIHALIFRPLVYNNTAELDKSPAIPSRAKLAGALSLFLWFGVLTFGRLIGYYEGPGSPGNQGAKSAAAIALPASHRASVERYAVR
ncbi:MAG: hypothetical protein JO323_13055 [Acidobacteriia bacterium]|nr:hypothetical protein [Terriglobia bacterium]